MNKAIICLLLILISGAVTAQNIQTDKYTEQIKEFDEYVEQARKDWNVPGLAIAIVKDNKILFTKGYGVKQLGLPDPVDTQTLFVCASTTKAMTAACMGILVDEGKVKWDDAVIKYLPEFQLYDPYVTRELKIRDLFLHNSGVGNADFLWVDAKTTSDEILYKMRLVKPSYSVRSSFIYQNLFYLVAGKVIEKVSGQPWKDFIRHRIFEPLEMTRTAPMMKDIKDANQTKSHYTVKGNTMVIENENADEIGPAGSVWSSIDDISKWVLCMLDSSKYKGGPQRQRHENKWGTCKKGWLLFLSPFVPRKRLDSSLSIRPSFLDNFWLHRAAAPTDYTQVLRCQYRRCRV